jgi:hypothetical protein
VTDITELPPEITDGNLPCEHRHQPGPGPFGLRPQFPVEQADLLAHLYEDVHEVLRRLAEWDEMITELRPLLDAWRRTNGGTMGLVKARKAARRGT